MDYDRVRLLWPDHLGLARGKYLPREKAEKGTAHCITLFTLGFDREMTPHDGALFWQGLPDCDAIYDPEKVRPGWEKRTGVVIPDISRVGEPVPLAPRHVLSQVVDRWKAHGLHPMVGIELEAYLFEPDGSGGWQPIDTPVVPSAPDDGEALLVLAPFGFGDLGEVVTAALPVGPDQRHGPGVVLMELGAFGKEGGDPVGMGAVLDRDHLPGVVPRRGGHDRRLARRSAGKEEPFHQRKGRYSFISQSVTHLR